MKVGDIIKCADRADCKEMLAELSRAGYGAVVTGASLREIRITSLPKEERTTTRKEERQ